MINESWKSITDYEEFYQISNLGRVKSLSRTIINVKGFVHKRKERILRNYSVSKGYLAVDLAIGKKRHCPKVHRLVALEFIPNPNNYPQVNHIDGDKTNNKVNNLEWCTCKYNINHAHKNKLTNPAKGTSHGRCVLTEEQVLNIIREYKTGDIFQYQLADKYNISQGQVYNIVSGKQWKHLKEKQVD
jgi:hypothetical protein